MRGPSRGSVRCWVTTAPTLERIQGTREPIAMSEVVVAMPSWPVRSHRPMIEKVMILRCIDAGLPRAICNSVIWNCDSRYHWVLLGFVGVTSAAVAIVATRSDYETTNPRSFVATNDDVRTS